MPSVPCCSAGRLSSNKMADVTEIGDLSWRQREPHARARNACLETLAAISFGRHHRLRGRGAEDRESVAPAAPSVATDPRFFHKKKSLFPKMGFFNDKSGNPAYILAEKVRRHGGHARLATPRVVTARALPRLSRVCRPFRPQRLVSLRERNASFAESESRHLEETRGFRSVPEKKGSNRRLRLTKASRLSRPPIARCLSIRSSRPKPY